MPKNRNVSRPRRGWETPRYWRMRSHAKCSCLGHLRSSQCRSDCRIHRPQIWHQLCGECKKKNWVFTQMLANCTRINIFQILYVFLQLIHKSNTQHCYSHSNLRELSCLLQSVSNSICLGEMGFVERFCNIFQHNFRSCLLENMTNRIPNYDYQKIKKIAIKKIAENQLCFL